MKKVLLSAAFAGLLCPALMAQTVTLGTTGADYTSLQAAISGVRDNAAAPDVINIIDEGPFLEGRVIVNSSTHNTDDLTIQALPGSGLRPVVVCKTNADGAFYLRKSGNLIIRDLVVIPTVDFGPGEYEDNVAQAGIAFDDDGGIATSVTLHNVLVSSNNGSNQPVASLDGLTSPTFTENTVSFRDEGILANSASTDAIRNIYLYDVVVSGVAGTQGSDGIRGFWDGILGSEWVIGPGCVVSYNNHAEAITSQTVRGAFQPGGNNGLVIRVEGTQEKPVMFINNNLNGIAVTNTAINGEGLVSVEWCIIANNAGAGHMSVDPSGLVTFTNVTYANNADGAFAGPANADEKQYTFSNVIAAGNGGATDLANIIELIADDPSAGIFPSTFTATNSAIVLNGPYTLNNVDYGADGIASDTRWNVVLADNVDDDPQFVSLDPTNEGFAIVTNNAAYGTAGPLGQPLVGGGDIAPSSVEDWQLF